MHPESRVNPVNKESSVPLDPLDHLEILVSREKRENVELMAATDNEVRGVSWEKLVSQVLKVTEATWERRETKDSLVQWVDRAHQVQRVREDHRVFLEPTAHLDHVVNLDHVVPLAAQDLLECLVNQDQLDLLEKEASADDRDAMDVTDLPDHQDLQDLLATLDNHQSLGTLALGPWRRDRRTDFTKPRTLNPKNKSRTRAILLNLKN